MSLGGRKMQFSDGQLQVSSVAGLNAMTLWRVIRMLRSSCLLFAVSPAAAPVILSYWSLSTGSEVFCIGSQVRLVRVLWTGLLTTSKTRWSWEKGNNPPPTQSLTSCLPPLSLRNVICSEHSPQYVDAHRSVVVWCSIRFPRYHPVICFTACDGEISVIDIWCFGAV